MYYQHKQLYSACRSNPKIATQIPYCTVNVQFFKHKPLIINKTLFNFIFTKTVHFYWHIISPPSACYPSETPYQ